MRSGRRLRWCVACVALAAAGVLAAVTTGPGLGAIKLPTLPTVTVSTPVATTTISINPPPVPPTPPPPVSVPKVTPPPPAPPPSPPSNGGSSNPPPPSGGSGSHSRTNGTTGRSTRSAHHAVRLSHGHPVVFVFRLASGRSVHFVLRRCGVAEKFTVAGHSGVNRVRFHGTVHGRRLAPGTYRVRAHSRGHTVLRTKLVVSGVASPCGSIGGAANDATSLGGSSGGVNGGSPKQPGTHETASPAPTSENPAPADSGGVLGARASKIIPGSGGTQVALLVVLLGAILLLALGALPRGVVPHAGAAAFVARRRAIFAAAGLAALTAFLVSYFVS